MAIRQQGGVFGRNPTFNDVDTNDLTVEGQLLQTGSENVGIGTASPSGSGTRKTVHIDGANGAVVRLSDASNSALLRYNTLGSLDLMTIGAVPLGLYTSNTERLNIASGGDVTVKTGNLIIGTSGKGIDFSATAGTGTSELFDDYEEGTWTPEAADAASGGNLATPSLAAGFYRKIGDMVFLHGYLGNISVSGMTAGNVFYIRNLPYAPSSAAGLASFYAGSLWCQAIDFADMLVPILISSTSYITLENVRSGLNDVSALVSDLNPGGLADLSFTIAYPTA